MKNRLAQDPIFMGAMGAGTDIGTVFLKLNMGMCGVTCCNTRVVVHREIILKEPEEKQIRTHSLKFNQEKCTPTFAMLTGHPTFSSGDQDNCPLPAP